MIYWHRWQIDQRLIKCQFDEGWLDTEIDKYWWQIYRKLIRLTDNWQLKEDPKWSKNDWRWFKINQNQGQNPKLTQIKIDDVKLTWQGWLRNMIVIQRWHCKDPIQKWENQNRIGKKWRRKTQCLQTMKIECVTYRKFQ